MFFFFSKIVCLCVVLFLMQREYAPLVIKDYMSIQKSLNNRMRLMIMDWLFEVRHVRSCPPAYLDDVATSSSLVPAANSRVIVNSSLVKGVRYVSTEPSKLEWGHLLGRSFDRWYHAKSQSAVVAI